MNLILQAVRKSAIQNCRKFSSTARLRNKMNVYPIEALSDNYMYLLVDNASNECAVVDPVEPEKVLHEVNERKLKLTKVLTTHHHSDHAGGNTKLLKMLNTNIPVYGGDDRIQSLSHKVGHNELIQLGSSITIKSLFTPCHTTGHICYYVEHRDTSSTGPLVFTGDTLFMAGCGRFFEGTPIQMYDALINILAKLPKETKVYCGHEYTVSNLKYALFIEPDNEDIKNKLAWASKQRESNLPTIPSTIGDELKFNPFMRVLNDSIHVKLGESDPIKCMGILRTRKDNWKP